jgi:protein-tyrosine-phosphatase
MAARGIDLLRHRSQPVSYEMVQASDLIIVMEEKHRQSLFYLEPRALRKVFLLSEMAGDSDPLLDVMGRPLPEVRRACDQAEQWLVDGWHQVLSRLALTQPLLRED